MQRTPFDIYRFTAKYNLLEIRPGLSSSSFMEDPLFRWADPLVFIFSRPTWSHWTYVYWTYV